MYILYFREHYLKLSKARSFLISSFFFILLLLRLPSCDCHSNSFVSLYFYVLSEMCLSQLYLLSFCICVGSIFLFCLLIFFTSHIHYNFFSTIILTISHLSRFQQASGFYFLLNM